MNVLIIITRILMALLFICSINYVFIVSPKIDIPEPHRNKIALLTCIVSVIIFILTFCIKS